MKKPILQDKHIEHCKFRRYAEQLINRVSGTTRTHNDNSHEIDASISSIHKVIFLTGLMIIRLRTLNFQGNFSFFLENIYAKFQMVFRSLDSHS